MQNNMDGIFNKIVLLLFVLLAISCKKEDKMDAIKNNLIAEGKVLIKQNSNVLVDSLERYDMNILHPEGKLKPLQVALLDSVGINERFSRETLKCIRFKLEEGDFSSFKSPYKLNLVKKEVSEVHVLFVSFLNLEIKNDLANIVVKKINGISSTIDRYYFKKQNNKWVLINKHQMSMG
jgi:hypothetical protein